MFDFDKPAKRQAKLRTVLALLVILSLGISAHPVLADPLTPQLVKDINPGAANSNPGKLTMVDGMVYFVATTPASGTELWRSIGTTRGTSLVDDIKAGAGDSDIRELKEVSGTLF